MKIKKIKGKDQRRGEGRHHFLIGTGEGVKWKVAVESISRAANLSSQQQAIIWRITSNGVVI